MYGPFFFMYHITTSCCRDPNFPHESLQPVSVGVGLILIINHFNFRHMHAVVLIILICYKLIINRGGGGSSSWPVSTRLRPSCSRLFVSVPDFSKKGIFPYLCGSEYSQHFWVKYPSSSCQIEKSGPAFSLSLLAYCVVAHSACQKVHFISHWLLTCTNGKNFMVILAFVDIAW